jgi:hypothetical protein
LNTAVDKYFPSFEQFFAVFLPVSTLICGFSGKRWFFLEKAPSWKLEKRKKKRQFSITLGWRFRF